MKSGFLRIVVLVIALVLVCGSAQSQAPAATATGDHGNKYIVLFRDGTDAPERAATVGRAGAALRFNYHIVNAAAITVPAAAALNALRLDPSVIEIIPDRTVSIIPEGKPAKPGGGGSGQVLPAGVKRVGVPSATSGAGVGVAIVDTGVDLSHGDLSPVIDGYNATSPGTSCQDNNGHGTHVAGIVAAHDNTQDVIGVAPGATLYCVKVLDASGSGSDSEVMAGLEWVFDNRDVNSAAPIRVVNMSLGRPGTVDDNPTMRAAVAALYNAGVVVVVAAGNDASKEVTQQVPATYPEVLAVASTTALDGTNACSRYNGLIKQDTASYFTTDGKFQSGMGVTISAPGEDAENISRGCLISSVGILSLKLGGGTTRMSGTSMASPHVAGVVARRIAGSTPYSSAAQVEGLRGQIRDQASNKGTAPINSPTSSYTYDGEREGVATAP